MEDSLKGGGSIEQRYFRAAKFQRSIGDMKKLALNTVIVPHWIDGENLWYRKRTEVGCQFILVDAKSKEKREAFDHKALASSLAKICQVEIDANNLPISCVRIVLEPCEVYFKAFDNDYRFDVLLQQCQSITPQLNMQSLEELISPDGKKIAFIREYNLWLRDVMSGEECPLTQDGTKSFSYANASAAFGIAVSGNVQALWSPDSSTLFTVQVDTRQVKKSAVIHNVPEDGSVRPFVEEYPIAYPGDEHVEELRLLAIDTKSCRQQSANYRHIPSNRAGYGLISDALAWWSDDSRYAYFVDMERGDQIAYVVEFDTQTGSTRILFEETSKTYINLSPSEITPATLLPIPETGELIWYSERDGWGHLYLYDVKTGKIKNPITQGSWLVRNILHLDMKNRELWIQTAGRIAGRDPYLQDICTVNIDTGYLSTIISTDHEYTPLAPKTPSSLWAAYTDQDWQINSCGVSPNGRYIFTTRSRVDEVPATLLITKETKEIRELESADASGLPKNWVWPEPVKLLAADGQTDLYGTIFRPSNFEPDRKYPVIDCSVCVAEFASVPKGSFDAALFGGLMYLQAAAFAELGFVVVMIDGRGTPHRNRAFVDASYGWVPSSNFSEDRIAGIKKLAKRYPYMDVDRVGIVGFGGTVGAVYGLLEDPDFYKVGVSHALQDTRVMGSLWGELYEGGVPATGKHQYAEQLAGNLQGKLLLMHGLLDRMDHSAATWRLVDALQKANKDFDMVILPSDGATGMHIESPYAFRTTWDYFVCHLLGEVPPKEFKL